MNSASKVVEVLLGAAGSHPSEEEMAQALSSKLQQFGYQVEPVDLQGMDERYLLLLYKRHVEGYNDGEIGAQLGVSRNRIRFMMPKAEQAIRKGMTHNDWADAPNVY